MNATTFFSESMYDQLKRDIATEKIISIFDTPYGKKIKTNGNEYEILIRTARYVSTDEYFVSLWDNYNHANSRGSREIGGGCRAFTIPETYEAFTDKINALLQHFPDYTAPVFEPIQISWF